MRALWAVALLIASSVTLSIGQQTTSPATSPAPASAPTLATDAPSERVKVYAVGPDVTTPLLLPHDFTTELVKKCKERQAGTVVFSVLVDTAGLPRNLTFLRPLYSDLDDLAFHIASTDRFIPGTHNGVPVVVGQTVEVTVEGCLEETKDAAGKITNQMKLKSISAQKFGPLPEPLEDALMAPGTGGIFRIGGDVTPPRTLYSPNPEFTDDARRAKYQGTCVLSLIVDTHGMPQNVHIEKPLGYGLSDKAVEAVRKYRFEPAMKEGVPESVFAHSLDSFIA
jgi:TonB family protein